MNAAEEPAAPATTGEARHAFGASDAPPGVTAAHRADVARAASGWQRAVLAYAFAGGAVLVAAGVATGIHHLTGSSYLFPLLFAVIVIAWYCGLRPGLLCLAGAIVAASVFLFAPFYSDNVGGRGDLTTLVLFSLLALAIVVMAARGRASIMRSEESERRARESLTAGESAILGLRQVEAITDVALNHLDLDDLLRELLIRVREHLVADTASVFLLSDDGIELVEVACGGTGQDAAAGRRLRIGNGFAGRIAATREPLVAQDLRAEPVAGSLFRPGIRSAMGVPIIRNDRLIGVLTAASERAGNFENDGLGLIELVAGRMAAAVDHANLFQQAQETTAELIEANALKDDAVSRHRMMEEHLRLLVDASGSLIESLEIDEMLPKILRLATTMINADAYAVWSMDEGRTTWGIRASEGLSAEYLARWSAIVIDENTAPMESALIAPDVEAVPILRDRKAGLEQEGVRSLLALPLRVGGALTGTVTFYYRERHEFAEEELQIASALANLSSSALGLTRLRRDEERARGRMEEANRKLAFLARASDVLGESLEYEVTLQQVAQLAVPLLADWCAVNIVDDHGRSHTIAVAHRDPEKVRSARELEKRYPAEADPDAEHGWPRVLRTREPDLLEEIPAGLLLQAAMDDEHARLITELGLRSSLVVPLIARERVVGAITLVTADLHEPLTRADIPLAQELARRAAIAIDNAELYREAQRVAADLQAANAAKDEFLGLVSHELRTPITVILGNSHVLVARADRIDEETRTEALRDINVEAERLSRIIENLLVLARIESGSESEDEPVHLERCVSKVLDAERGRMPWRAITLTANEPWLLVNGSEFCIEQTLRNFLSNADKYSPPDAPIDLVVAREDGAAVVRVLDRGAGISADEAENVFEPFYRSAATSSVSGVGIGLTVCKRLVEAHGGRVWARAREGGGSEFGFGLRMTEPPGGETAETQVAPAGLVAADTETPRRRP